MITATPPRVRQKHSAVFPVVLAVFLCATAISMPIGLMGKHASLIVWSPLMALCLALSAWLLDGMIDRPHERGYLLLVLAFPPALACIESGEAGLIVLLGLALFLRFHNSRPFWAGVSLSLCAIKPYLLLPFGVGLLSWLLFRKRWMVIAGGTLAIMAESLVGLCIGHFGWVHPWATSTPHFVREFTLTLGGLMRFGIDRKALWLQYLPAIFGCAWALWYFLRNRHFWDWKTDGSLLTLVSLVTAPYSSFTDQVIAVPAVLFVLLGASRARRGSVSLLILIMIAKEFQAVATASIFSKTDILLPLLWLAWYLYATSERGGDYILQRIRVNHILQRILG